MHGVTSLEVTEGALRVHWAGGGEPSAYPWLWLRDHGHEPATLHPVTLQRQLFTGAVADDIQGRAALLAADGRSVAIVWPAGEESHLPLAFLWRFRDPRPGSVPAAAPALPWDAAIAERPPRVPYDAIMAGDDGLRRWLEAVEVHGFCLVDGVPPTPADTAALARRIGYLRETIFGAFWDFTADLAKADTAYTNLELRPHTDGTYARDAPGLQLLHCLQFAGRGGESILVDGFRIADELRAADAEAYAALATDKTDRTSMGQLL